MEIRTATINDLKAITEVESKCFPKSEAASENDFRKRLEFYPNCFWILEKNNKIISFVNGMVSNEDKIEDEMFKDASFHNENGEWQMIFGVNTIPEYRKQGYAEKVIKRVISDAKKQGRKGLVLTCKDKLIHYYEKFGFINEGISQSSHGNAIWYDMRLEF